MIQPDKIGSRGPRQSIEDRLWGKVHRAGETECWFWTGAKTRLGYGNFWDGTYTASGHPRMVEAHRWAYRHFVRDPGEMHVRHTCDVRLCVNFMAHLLEGTVGDNMRDRDSRGRGVIPPPWGFAKGIGQRLTADQVREIRRTYTGARGEQRRMAVEYGVTHQTISDILRGKSWIE